MKKTKNGTIGNSKAGDSGGKLIFGNPRLLAQLLRDYSGMEILKDVKPEDIEYNGRKISGLLRRMLARECVSENVGVAGC